ncbi:mitochondrial 54S ribosomal protein YmL41 [Maublancomyces gigas]|uniref:Large ribosomal subunit protein uL23m n=1 Tax=Discina gigas TaxID=1032678 RepID=A0ABR3GC19_9PEZI
MKKFGSKSVFLPSFTLAMVRTTHLPPNFVQFIVPLNINKLDLKDYLHHAYGVECLSVRSYIEQQKIMQTKRHLGERHVEWYRPRAIKKMTVELAEPFIYPEEPTDLTPWGKAIHTAREKEDDERRLTMGPEATLRPSPIRAKLKQHAEELLTQTEVEKDLKV